MNIVVTGSRSLTDREKVIWALGELIQRPTYPEGSCAWHHGGARGADVLVDEWLREGSEPITVHRPDYERHGRRAPHVRNDEMLDVADVVLAIWDGESKGTASVIGKAASRGIPVYVEIVGPA